MSCSGGATIQQCNVTSVGAANQLFLALIQTVATAQCSIASPTQWPKDYGKYALKNGI